MGINCFILSSWVNWYTYYMDRFAGYITPSETKLFPIHLITPIVIQISDRNINFAIFNYSFLFYWIRKYVMPSIIPYTLNQSIYCMQKCEPNLYKLELRHKSILELRCKVFLKIKRNLIQLTFSPLWRVETNY